MGNAIERFANSTFMKKLQAGSQRLSQNEVFATISGGMGATMGLIMIGAVIQIVCALGALLFGWDSASTSYQMFYMPYKLTMGMLGFFMCFTMAYNFAKRKGLHPMQSGFTALVCYLLVVSPVVTATAADGTTTFDALNLGNLGSGGMFVAIIVGLCSVAISKFVVKHNWVIKLPDVVPEGILNSFNAIIPTALNIIVWYGLAIAISGVSNGTLTLSSMITYVLSIPMNYLVSAPGMFLVIMLGNLCWFFGIHGTGVIFAAIMIPYFTAYQTNASLAASGMPLQWFPVFLFGMNAILGGSGNTLPLCVMGLKSKSKRISAVAKASIGPGLFNINEPAIFGFPIMYNATLLIPFILAPMAVGVLMLAAYQWNLMAYPSVMILTTLPVGLQSFMGNLDWRSFIFVALIYPVCHLIYYPFFKVYEKQCLEQEALEEAGN